MNKRRQTVRQAKSRKKYLILGSFFVVILAYFGFVNHVVSSHPSFQVDTASQLATSKYQKPPFEDFVQGWNITGDVSWLLDFAIVGFPKTGTSSLMLYLEHARSVFVFDEERCELGWNQQAKLLKDLYDKYRPNRRMGIKCPRDLEIDLSLDNYNKFFPTTKFIVGVRHPIIWFESFYNFRVNNEFEMPPAQKLIGRCKRFNQGVCTFRANFSKHLEKIEPWRDVFLYNVEQLKDKDSPRSTTFRQDLGDFLTVSRPLEDPMIWVKPGQKGMSPEKAKEINSLKINICDDQYQELRDVLSEQASQSADWIQSVFIKQDNVKVSSPEHFIELLQTWRTDPCNKSRN